MPGSGLDTMRVAEVAENIASVPEELSLLEELEIKSGRPLKKQNKTIERIDSV